MAHEVRVEHGEALLRAVKARVDQKSSANWCLSVQGFRGFYEVF